MSPSQCRTLLVFGLLSLAVNTHAADAYDATNKLLTIPQVTLDNTTYTNVVLKLNDFQVLQVDPVQLPVASPATRIYVQNTENSAQDTFLYPLTLSASGALDNQTITVSVVTPTLGDIVEKYANGGTTTPFTALPTRIAIYADAVDNRALDGKPCIFANDKEYRCLDTAPPVGSFESETGNYGDAALEYLRLPSSSNAVQIDTPTTHFQPPIGSNNFLFGTWLGDLPLNSLSAPLVSENIIVSGSLTIRRAYLAIEYRKK